jgi:beta-phosphoglucomutase-like phosphatase (HAD superfamily)
MKTILWDFDGVILESMRVRDWGVEEIFRDYDQKLIDQLLAYYGINRELTRYVKVRYFFEELLCQSITKERILEYAQKFSTPMYKEWTNSKNLILEAVNFIENKHPNYNFHIVLGSDQ